MRITPITHHFSIAHVLTTVGGRARHPHPPQRGCHFSTDPVPAVVLIDVYYVNIGLFRLRGDQLVIMLWLFWACFLVVACVAVCRITLSNKNTAQLRPHVLLGDLTHPATGIITNTCTPFARTKRAAASVQNVGGSCTMPCNANETTTHPRRGERSQPTM